MPSRSKKSNEPPEPNLDAQLELFQEFCPPPSASPPSSNQPKRRQKETLERVRADTRNALTKAIDAQGGSTLAYRGVTEAVYDGMFDQNSSEFYQSRQVPFGDRDALEREDQEQIISGEIGARKGIEAQYIDSRSQQVERDQQIVEGAKEGVKVARSFWDGLTRLFGG